MRTLKIVVYLFLLSIPFGVNAQAPTPTVGFKILSFRKNDKLILRWAFDNPAQWRYVNTKGVNIERADDNSGKFQKLNKEPIRPINNKEDFLKLDTNSKTYASMLYVFNTPKDQESKGDKDYQQYTMYYVTTSFEIEAAVLTGSAYIDLTAEPGKKYSYRITVANSKVPQTNNTILVSEKNTDLPKGPAIDSRFSNRSVGLIWDIKNLKEDYFAFVLERSTDSLNYKAIQPPIIKISSPDEKPEDSTKIGIIDSIPNRIKYYYRVRGLNIFGELGKSGDVISGMAYPDLNLAPFIKGVDSFGLNKLTIEWILPDSLHDAVQKYEIYRSKKFDTGFVKIDEIVGAKSISKEFINTSKDLSSYFKVKAIGNRYNQYTESEPFLYQLIDSIPPAVPTGLTGTVDSAGVVTIKWANNKELDFLGYRILRAQKKEDEFVLLNATPQNMNLYNDTLPVDQLNTVMYYRLAAVDARYNESKQSEILEVRRPDFIPPAPPRMDLAKVVNDQVHIEWIKSFSKDVENYIIFKRIAADTTNTWTQIITAKNTDTAYLDADVKPGNTYYYSVQAIDMGKLKSQVSEPISVTLEKASTAFKGIKSIVPFVSRQYKYIELSWQNSEPDAETFWVYRTSPGQDLSLVKVIPAKTKKYVDEDVVAGTVYKYAIKVVYNNGRSSRMERVEVNY